MTSWLPASLPMDLAGERLDPDAAPFNFSVPRAATTAADPLSRLGDLLRRPTVGPPLRADPPAVLVVPDATRGTFVRPIAEAVLEHWQAAGLGRADLAILVAGGLHRPPTATELRELLGPEIPQRIRVHVHDADDPELADLGLTRRGTPVLLPKQLLAARTVAVAGGISPHYFAGWTGGPKGLVPGAAGRATIVANHRLSVMPDEPGGLAPTCREGRLRSNPVAFDLREAARHVARPFLVNVVFGREGEARGIVSGSLEAAHRAGVRWARRSMAVEAERAALVLVSPAHPGRERDLIQAHKVLRQGATLTADGGTLIALAACRDGIGSGTLMDWFDVPPADLPRAVAARYTLHGHTALAIRAMTQRIRVVLVSELPAEVVQRIGMVPAASLGEALAMATREHRPGTRALLLSRAGSLLPIPLN